MVRFAHEEINTLREIRDLLKPIADHVQQPRVELQPAETMVACSACGQWFDLHGDPIVVTCADCTGNEVVRLMERITALTTAIEGALPLMGGWVGWEEAAEKLRACLPADEP
jgi:protein-arginine kinase activator protein McsA